MPTLETSHARLASAASLLSNQRLAYLDGLRGVAILMVLLWHYFVPDLKADSMMARLLSMTWTGVDLFFVLSGFLITGILLDHRESRHYFKTFYVRRACRILPLYALVLASFYAVRSFVPQTSDPSRWLFADARPFWTYVTFMQNFAMAEAGFGAAWLSVTWSLAIEEQFYLVLPFVIRFAPREFLFRILVTFVVAAPVFRIGGAFLYEQPAAAGFFLMPSRADALLLGAVGAYIWRNPAVLEQFRKRQFLVFAGFGGLAAGAGLMSFFLPHHASMNMTVWGRSWLALMYFGVVIIPLLFPNNPLEKALCFAVFRKLGTISYGLYLIHLPVLGLAFLFAADRLNALPLKLIALLSAILLAAWSYKILEKPLLKLGHRYEY